MKPRLCIAMLALATLAVAGCGGTAQTTESRIALPLWQRVLQGGDMPGFVADKNPPVALDLPAFVDQAKESFVRITPEGAVRELTADGFRGAMITTQQLVGKKPIVASAVIQLGSSAQAEKAMAWAYTDSTSPCPDVCNVDIEPFDVPGLPGAKGVRRSRDEDTGGSGPNDPFEAFEIQFTDGPFLYDVLTLDARPGDVAKEDVIPAAKAIYKRVAGSPPLAR